MYFFKEIRPSALDFFELACSKNCLGLFLEQRGRLTSKPSWLKHRPVATLQFRIYETSIAALFEKLSMTGT